MSPKLTEIEGPQGGEVEIGLSLPPVRFKASRKRKDVLTNLIKGQTRERPFLFTGELQIHVEWLIHEQDRYESHRSPDIDNILKPILDAMQGPDGIMVNDSQVQALDCRWIDWPSHEQRIQLSVRGRPDEWIRKDGLFFVRMNRTLCMPMNRSLPAEGALVMLKAWSLQFETRERLMSLGMDYYDANGVMSIQRPFHVSRLQGFTVMSLDEARKQLTTSLPAGQI